MASVFERYDRADLRTLIEEFPLAWVIPSGGGVAQASLLPLLAVLDPSGDIVELVGHMARHNPLMSSLIADPRAMILFTGPQDYVSTTQAGRRDWAPTWNFAQTRVEVHVEFEPQRSRAALAELVAVMEGDGPKAWEPSELGARYDAMEAAIIPFRARVISIAGKFKLGQDERIDTLRSILSTLDDGPMRRWMLRFNKDRL